MNHEAKFNENPDAGNAPGAGPDPTLQMNVRMKFPNLALSALLLVLVGPSAIAKETDPSIVADGDAIRIKAGVLERVIRVSGGNVATESLSVSGTPLIAGRADELSFQITRAVPNRNPLELPLENNAAALSVTEAKANDTDALKVSGKTKPEPTAGQLQWTDERSFSAASWGPCFDLTNVAVTVPKPGVQRVVIRARSLKDPLLAGVSVNLIYEVYAGFPVIRKWVDQ